MQRVRSLYHISEGAPVFTAQNIVGRSAKLAKHNGTFTYRPGVAGQCWTPSERPGYRAP
jgi:hypothetical protein